MFLCSYVVQKSPLLYVFKNLKNYQFQESKKTCRNGIIHKVFFDLQQKFYTEMKVVFGFGN